MNHRYIAVIKHVTIAFLLCIIISSPAYAVVEAVAFDNPQTEQRYKGLIEELRCLVCQNQNLADSDAPLAKDLRRKTVELLKSGASDEEIIAYMRERYGDFVTYRPPFTGATALLWLGPFILLVLVIAGLVLNVKRRQQEELMKPTHANDEAQRVKVRNLLSDSPDLDSK